MKTFIIDPSIIDMFYGSSIEARPEAYAPESAASIDSEGSYPEWGPLL